MLPNVSNNIVGWDIGGANVKVANANEQAISDVYQLACPLWKGMHELARCIEYVKQNIDISQCKHAITMTGELVDYFDNRKQGVISIIEEMNKKLAIERVHYYAGDIGFINPAYAIDEYEKIASANWFASAQFVAEKIPNALFIDIGSTTTDVVTVRDHKVVYQGYTDSQRLIAKELVYCGVVRTPIFALCSSVLVNSQKIPIINEYFANMADIYRITGELPRYADPCKTLDGRDKGVFNSSKRLARMFASDANFSELDVWKAVALQVRTMQLQKIKDACRHQLMNKSISLLTPVIGAGVGRFLAKALALDLGREYIEFESLFDTQLNPNAFGISDCAPAAAVAYLASSQL